MREFKKVAGYTLSGEGLPKLLFSSSVSTPRLDALPPFFHTV